MYIFQALIKMAYPHKSKKSEPENLNNIIDSSITVLIKFYWHGMFSFSLCLYLVDLLLTKLCMQLNVCCSIYVVYFVSICSVVVNCVSVCVVRCAVFFVCVIAWANIYTVCACFVCTVVCEVAFFLLCW